MPFGAVKHDTIISRPVARSMRNISVHFLVLLCAAYLISYFLLFVFGIICYFLLLFCFPCSLFVCHPYKYSSNHHFRQKCSWPFVWIDTTDRIRAVLHTFLNWKRNNNKQNRKRKNDVFCRLTILFAHRPNSFRFYWELDWTHKHSNKVILSSSLFWCFSVYFIFYLYGKDLSNGGQMWRKNVSE